MSALLLSLQQLEHLLLSGLLPSTIFFLLFFYIDYDCLFLEEHMHSAVTTIGYLNYFFINHFKFVIYPVIVE